MAMSHQPAMAVSPRGTRRASAALRLAALVVTTACAAAATAAVTAAVAFVTLTRLG
jgi:hypothetical protein